MSASVKMPKSPAIYFSKPRNCKDLHTWRTTYLPNIMLLRKEAANKALTLSQGKAVPLTEIPVQFMRPSV